MAEVVTNKPHAVCIPWAGGQSHITPMLKLAKLLHSQGFYITFVNSECNHNRIVKAGGPDSLASLPDFRFETFADGISPPGADSPPDALALCDSSRRNFLAPLRNLVQKLNRSARVACIISDGVMPFTTIIAKELGVPSLVFWVVSACGFMGYKHHRQLINRGLLPLTEENRDSIIDWIPGLKDIRLRDIPHADIFHYDFPMKEAEEAFKASGIILNTFEPLEKDVLDAISSMFPHVYAIGPIHMLLNSLSTDRLKSIGSNLWEEEPHCLQWLNSMKHNSVVYISFGTSVFLTPHQLTEFAWGIFNSNHHFLWVIRPDLVIGEQAILPLEFLEKSTGRGLITSWCPQEQVLNHPSIGGFVTSCGWNSVLESICAGVPMICWPSIADQRINSRYICTKWGIGMEMHDDVNRDEVEKLVRELMEEDKGKGLEKKAMEWKKLVAEATSPRGSSTLNLRKLVEKVMGSSNL